MSAQTVVSESSLHDQLAAIEAKLDYVVERQRFLEELIDDMMPVARDALAVAAVKFQALEDEGVFEDVKRLVGNAGALLDTVRSATQPDVLALANDAIDVVHHVDDVAPVNLFGAVKATRDQDVQRGLAVALAILQKLGRAHGEPTTSVVPKHRAAPPQAPPEEKMPAPAIARATPPAPAKPVELPKVGDLIEWEGHLFKPDGFLADPATWDDVLATKIAIGLGIVLGEDHWKVLRWARHEWQVTGNSPNVRRIASGSGVGTAAMYELFPKTPGKSCAMIAGIPKPVGCV